MKSIFCEDTLDISIILSRKEVLNLKRNKYRTPVLEVEDKERIFHLMNTESKEYIGILEPRNLSNPHYWIRINDNAYMDLIRNDICGTRYGNSSKINIFVKDSV